jgi:hypothetical protein
LDGVEGVRLSSSSESVSAVVWEWRRSPGNFALSMCKFAVTSAWHPMPFGSDLKQKPVRVPLKVLLEVKRELKFVVGVGFLRVAFRE